MNASAAQPDLTSLFPGRGQAGSGRGEGFFVEALGEHAVISVADANGRMIYANRKFVELTGYCLEELIGSPYGLLKSEYHSPGFFREMWQTITSGQSWQGEFKNYRKTGEAFWMRVTIVPYLGADRKPEKYLSIGTDITETKMIEGARQQRLSFDLIKDEIYLFWPGTLDVFYANRGARIRLRALGQTMMGLTLPALLQDLPEENISGRLAPLIEGRRKWVSFEASQQRPDGRTNPAEVTIQMIAPDREEPHFLAHIRNISQRKQAEIAKQQFVANVSHELRTPLTTIKGAFELIRSGLCNATPERAGQLAAMGLKNTTRLENLIEDLLDMERIASGRMVSRLQKLDLSALIQKSIRDIASYKPEKSVSVRGSGIEAPIWVKGDEDRLRKVMANLLSNAVKFSREGGEVDILVERDGTRVGISVRDQGVGIPERALSTLFDPFTQADFPDRRPSEGAGLGLSISRAIIEEHGGAIEIDSTEGHGTEARFYVILHPSAAEA
ncbi:sensor histidine kinase [Pseudodonghicola xiamenensis]|nr:HAMP domain-containing sensor histidine kinase [Pseudodonghicola xiamenensis]